MATPDTEDRILVLMPTPRDAARTCDLLAGAGLTGVSCADPGAVRRELAAGAGAVLLADEALDGGDWLSAVLADQPPWSDLPLVVLTREGTGHASFRESANVTLVERPVRMRPLLSVVRAALRARRRQYEVRDLLAERQRAAEALRDERERLRITLASIGDAVISTDADGRVVFLNGVVEALTGWGPADAGGRPLTEVFRIVNEATRRTVENPALRALREGTIVGLANHTVLIARDGTERPIDDSAAPIRGGDGTVDGAVLVFRDITERRQAEAAQVRLAAIVESSDEAIIGKDLDGVIRSWNAGAERIFGYTAAEAVGRPITLLVPPERLDEERDILARLRRGERIDHFETARVRKDGSRVDISLTVSPIRDPEGRVTGASKVARDVTGRRRAEEAVRFLAAASASLAELVDYESTLRRIANLAVTGFADWCVVDVLDAAGQRHRLTVTGAEPEDVAAARAADAAFRSDEGASGVVPHVLRTGEPEVVFDLAGLDPATAPQGPERVTTLRELGIRSYLCVPLLSRGRAIGGMTFLSSSSRRRFGPEELRVAQNLADRVTTAIENAQLYRALQEQDRRKDEFLATLAHELRNPLAPVRNGVQILRAVLPPDPRAGKALDMMDRQLGQVVHLVDDLMDVSRVSSGKVVLRPERVALRAAIDAAVETARQAIEAAGHELALRLSPEPLALEADPTRLVQVLANLLNNAAKYTPQGGRIVVSAARDGDKAVVRVADTGVGIPADMLPRVFDLFTQVGTSLERSQGGLGIGLTLVKRLVEMHGGSVAAQSPGPGRGSTFTVRLPLAARTPAPPPSGPAESGGDVSRRPLGILVVDDNRDSADTLALLLEIKGHEVRTAHDGPEALRALGTFRPRLILLDLGLPGMSGYEVARRIRESAGLRGVTLAALTGWGQEEDRRRTRAAGFDHHLTKPADPAELERILGELQAEG